MQPNFHLAAFFGSVAASQTDLPISPVVDPSLTTNANGMLLPEPMRIGMVYASGLGLTQARISVPSLRIVSQPRINPVNHALYPIDDAPIIRYREQGPRILRSETFAFQATTDVTAGPNATYGMCWIYAGPRRVQSGDITTVRASSTIVAVTGTWVLGSLSMEQDLPAGRYAIVGADVTAANCIAMRFAFAGGGYRPGLLCQQNPGEFFLDTFRMGNCGVFGEFENSLPPQIDILGTSGSITLAVFLDIIKIG